MPKSKIAITLDPALLSRLDRLVSEGVFTSRSEAIAAAVAEHLERRERSRLARECARLDRTAERAFAEEGITGDLARWPAY